MSVKTVGKYEVTETIGEGSFGVVFKGRDPFLKRDVAIKLCTVEDDGLRQRFFREAEIAGRLEHPNVVTVFDFGVQDDEPYLVQEYLHGEDLRDVIRHRRPWPTLRKLDLLIQVAEGLAYAHGQGVIHRDVKPANIRVLSDGRIKIMDFGIAKLANQESQLTQKGVTMGTASYMPPEQVRGGDTDLRADIFSFGVLAYELLAYARPFRGKTISALVYQILYKVPTPLGGVWAVCPGELAELVGRCLEKQPDKRYPSFAEVLAPLRAICEAAAAGRWPGLLEAEGPAAALDATFGNDGDAMSQSLIARTAEAVTRKQAITSLDATVAVDDPPPPRPKSRESTQPVPIIPPAEAPTTKMPAAPRSENVSTRPAPAISPPQPPPAPAPNLDETPPELASSAHEISRLVAQGDLEAAMEQLEETINRQRDAEATGTAAGSTAAGAGTRSAVDPALPTLEMPKAPQPPPPPPAAGAQGPSPAAPTTGQALPSTVQLATQPAPPTTDRRRGPVRPLVVVAAVAVATLAVVAGWLISRAGSGPAETAVAARPAPPPAASTAPTAAPRSGLVIDSVPWAKVTEITDANGYVQEVALGSATPLFVELPAGQYKITLMARDGDQTQVCEVRVIEGTRGSCTATFAEPTATDYFKDSGWWR